jgi:hypothetical protein
MTERQRRRFYAQVDTTGCNGRYAYHGEPCHIWTGYRNRDGYGRYCPKHARPRLAHVMAWEDRHGQPVPAGLELDHLCRNRACVLHVRPVTHRENMRNTDKAQQTHCIRGHELSGHNLIINHSGTRSCRACKNAAERARYQQRKEATV